MPAAADVKYIRIGASRYIDHVIRSGANGFRMKCTNFGQSGRPSDIRPPRNRRLITFAFQEIPANEHSVSSI